MTSFDATTFDTDAFDAPVEHEVSYTEATLAILDHVQAHDLRGLNALSIEELQVQRAARKALFDYATWLAESRTNDDPDRHAIAAIRDLAGGLLGNTGEVS
ncbi:hypothetical protein [Fodinicola feengrottensis]|uniref:Uncharacterized protein n=1 Tax=Fodinicola feengrottensis TaxID=435914 RepID=A0ABN2GQ79_9ACTN|nr:hypothetical protein [Fodinicola feengrottensis]